MKKYLKNLVRCFDDGVLEVALFAPGAHHNGTQVYSEADLDELIATYDPTIHEAPSVIGHAEKRTSADPAYGWVDSLFKRDGLLWGRLKQVPQAFVEMVQQGAFKKRSVEIYTDFQGTGKKYLRAVAWLGAQPPEVKGLPDVAFAEDGGPIEEVACVDHPDNLLQRIWDELKVVFAEEAEADGPIVQSMNREEALNQFDRIRWIANEELYRIIWDEELSPEEKRAQVRALFDELQTLISQNGEDLIAAFTERSGFMNKKAPGAPQGANAVSEETLTETVNAAVRTALEGFGEQLGGLVKEQVDAGLQAVTQQARKTGVAVFCQRLREQGVQPALIDDSGLAQVLTHLPVSQTHAFSEGGTPQTFVEWFQDFLDKVVQAAKKDTLIVPFKELAGGDKKSGDGDAKTRALAEFEEGRATFEAMGITAEDLEKYGDLTNN